MRQHITNEPAARVRPALFYARLGNGAGLETLLDLGVSPDARAERGESLLIAAICRGQFGIVRLLLERGTSPNSGRSPSCTPLELARRMGSERAVARLAAARRE